MTPSLRRRLSWWQSLSVLAAGLVAASASFVLALDEATDSQDAQLEQVASALSRQAFERLPPEQLPKDVEEAETRFVIAPLGSSQGSGDAAVNFALPSNLAEGLHTIRHKGVGWRVMVSRDSSNRRFAVAQTLNARNEDALSTALFVLIPLALLIPTLLVGVRISIARAFAPLDELSRQADRVDGSNPNPLAADIAPAELKSFIGAVNRLLVRLADTLDQQRRLISNAAHELRSPVAALTLQAENIRAAPLDEESAHRLTALRGGLERIAQLIEQLIGFARLQSTVKRPATVLRFDSTVRAAIESVMPLAIEKGIDLGCPRLEPVHIFGTADDAYALVRNVVDNAVRYTPRGGTVDVSLQADGHSACLTVEDSGPGIAPADFDRVFEPFVRVLGSGESGSGLGLSIARGAAETMGGFIELANRSTPPGGLRVTYRQAAASLEDAGQASRQGV